MASNTSRPEPRSQPIDPSAQREILQELLDIERARLAEAVRMERERRIVFPETTVIIKDIERLVRALGEKEVDVGDSPDPDTLLDKLLGDIK